MDGAQQQHQLRHPFHDLQQLHQSSSRIVSVPRALDISVVDRSFISYRNIRPSDLAVLQSMHEALFPIKYEKDFFSNVVHGRGILSWAAVDTSRSDSKCDELIGFVTARVITASEDDELDMLGYEISKSERTLIYILTLGVAQSYRNTGIASALLWEVIEYANQMSSCRAIYLHVIAYNRPAIMFYQKNMFQCLRRLHSFYTIEGQNHDAFLYVYYVNGGRSPCTAIVDVLQRRIESSLCLCEGVLHVNGGKAVLKTLPVIITSSFFFFASSSLVFWKLFSYLGRILSGFLLLCEEE